MHSVCTLGRPPRSILSPPARSARTLSLHRRHRGADCSLSPQACSARSAGLARSIPLTRPLCTARGPGSSLGLHAEPPRWACTLNAEGRLLAQAARSLRLRALAGRPVRSLSLHTRPVCSAGPLARPTRSAHSAHSLGPLGLHAGPAHDPRASVAGSARAASGRRHLALPSSSAPALLADPVSALFSPKWGHPASPPPPPAPGHGRQPSRPRRGRPCEPLTLQEVPRRRPSRFQARLCSWSSWEPRAVGGKQAQDRDQAGLLPTMRQAYGQEPSLFHPGAPERFPGEMIWSF